MMERSSRMSRCLHKETDAVIEANASYERNREDPRGLQVEA